MLHLIITEYLILFITDSKVAMYLLQHPKIMSYSKSISAISINAGSFMLL